MMDSLAAPGQDLASTKAARALAIAISLLLLLGFALAESAEQLLAYVLILSAAVLPSILWIRLGARGIPVLQVAAMAHIPYFAWPILSGNESALEYTQTEITRAALTVAAYLLVATAAWYAILPKMRLNVPVSTDSVGSSRVIRLVQFGLFVGLAFNVSNSSGWLASLGPYFGLVRTIASTSVILACFLLGVTRAQGLIRGKAFAIAGGALCLLVALSWSSLMLVGGITYFLAVAFGYVMVARRIPWLSVTAILIAVVILHSGKADMRDKYWADDSSGISSVFSIPGLMAEWAENGLRAIVTGDTGQSVIDRASLLQMLLLTQTATPNRVNYLMGETYSFLPAIIIPRFVESDKPASQVGMDVLNIRYGLLTVEGTASTAIGWGLIAEAYANFGYFGVIGVAIVLGAVCGAFAVASANSPRLISLANLLSIATMMGFILLELDLIQLVSSLLQAYGVVLFFFMAYKWTAFR